jgi:hypothetical protein
MNRHFLILIALPFLLSCSEDALTYVCVNEDATFDIEEVSTLEDAMGLPTGHDAVVLDYDATHLPEGGTWRVSSVDILLMIPASQFDYYPTNIKLGVEVFDGENPSTAPQWTVTQTVDVTKLEWQTVNLNRPDGDTEPQQRAAWWRFDFSGTIPEEGMNSTTFVVGAAWSASSLPTIGYSNFNRPCNRNWTLYDPTEGWVLNSEREDPFGSVEANSCNWPMLRVNVEERHEADSCAK